MKNNINKNCDDDEVYYINSINACSFREEPIMVDTGKFYGRFFSQKEMDRIICEFITRHPYVAGERFLTIHIMKRKPGMPSDYYHLLSFTNNNAEQQERDLYPTLRYELPPLKNEQFMMDDVNFDLI